MSKTQAPPTSQSQPKAEPTMTEVATEQTTTPGVVAEPVVTPNAMAQPPAEPSVSLSQLQTLITQAIEQTVKSTKEGEQERIQAAVADALKKHEEAKTPAPASTAVETPIAQAQLVTPQVVDGKLYGNADTKKAIDLRTILPHLQELPTDKYTIVIQAFMRNGKGQPVEDESMRRIQFIDKDVFERNSKPNEETGKSMYDAMFKYVLVGKPTD